MKFKIGDVIQYKHLAISGMITGVIIALPYNDGNYLVKHDFENDCFHCNEYVINAFKRNNIENYSTKNIYLFINESNMSLVKENIDIDKSIDNLLNVIKQCKNLK